MKHLALAAPMVLFAAGCGKDSTPPQPDVPKSRSEAVVATTSTPKTADPPKTVAKPTGPRKLCEAAPAAVGRGVPTMKVAHMEAPGAPSLGDKIPSGGGKWTWINFWAAWCAPCKEEIPRLRAFEQKLNAEGRPVSVVFVSLDDDQRQAQKFLESQPATGLRTSFWLEEGKMRAEWLASVKMKADPQLPQQLLFDPQGALKCIVDGAVEDADYEALKAFLAKK